MKTLIVLLVILIGIFVGAYFIMSPTKTVSNQPAVVVSTSTPVVPGAHPVSRSDTQTYTDAVGGFSIVLPAYTLSGSASSNDAYSINSDYQYTLLGPTKTISGTKFTIPASYAVGTNLSKDSYLSVEHSNAQICTATDFLPSGSTISISTENGASYSVGSSVGSAAGNRYEETVYAIKDSHPCIAVRYFIHYGALANYPKGAVVAFNKDALLQKLHIIRQSLVLNQVAATGVVDNTSSTLKVGESTTINGLGVRLDKILSDNRCPKNVQCIVAGAVRVALTVSMGGKMIPVTMASDGPPFAIETYTMRIIDIAPPRSSKVIPQVSDYVLTFRVGNSK